MVYLARPKPITPELKLGETKYGQIKVAVWTVRGHDIDIWFGSHLFHAEFDGKGYDGPTIDILIEKLKDVTRRAAVKVEIPFSYQRGSKVLDGVITGIHGSTRNILVRWNEDPDPDRARFRGKKTLTAQLPYTYDAPFYRPLTDEEKAELFRLERERRDAENALRKFNNVCRIDPHQVIEAVLAAGKDEASPEPEIIGNNAPAY